MRTDKEIEESFEDQTGTLVFSIEKVKTDFIAETQHDTWSINDGESWAVSSPALLSFAASENLPQADEALTMHVGLLFRQVDAA